MADLGYHKILTNCKVLIYQHVPPFSSSSATKLVHSYYVGSKPYNKQILHTSWTEVLQVSLISKFIYVSLHEESKRQPNGRWKRLLKLNGFYPQLIICNRRLELLDRFHRRIISLRRRSNVRLKMTGFFVEYPYLWNRVNVFAISLN